METAQSSSSSVSSEESTATIDCSKMDDLDELCQSVEELEVGPSDSKEKVLECDMASQPSGSACASGTACTSSSGNGIEKLLDKHRK